ncbi:high affinity sulfate permease [Schizopora paradoxa]|uniref:High affinity sulfate permease n=1 Tax=Schizopora paradoxa TaxID=27342 RepID=A0A0H2S2N7_9AGAM|nr:high affinity sulfate permease [Schizopora paradoxa]
MAIATSVKNFAKATVGHKDGVVPTVTTEDWARSVYRDPKKFVVDYFVTLFPILGWIGRYNFGWLTGDLIAGITVGIVLVPQSMSYAQIATLPPQYGLYSAFVGVFVYCFFATSKDVSIGPVAVMSLTVSQIIKAVNHSHPNEWEPQTIATTVSFICGFIVLGIGLLRLGFIVEFIPAPAVSGFMTGSAINIVVGQIPGLMGITGFDTRAATYLVIINSLKGLGRTTKDAAFGLTGLFALYAFRILFDRLSKRYPRRARLFFFLSVLRNGFVIVVLTIAAWLYTRHRKSEKGTYPIKILQTVPRGFQHVGPPSIQRPLLSALAGHIPVATIILLLEHIAISKSFGRVNGYKINPNQELIAIGVTNTVGSVFNAYPATGSFSRSALKSKCGVRTPLAGIFTGLVVIVALYGLTPAFFWIPSAGLSAIIIHAVADLVEKPKKVYEFWRVSPLEFVIWWAAVLVTVFSTIEDGIYTSICTSLALLLYRIARPRGNFLGRAKVSVDDGSDASREVFLPLKLADPEERSKLAPGIDVRPPAPGVLVYRLEESLLYPNCSLLNSTLVDYVKAHTRRGKDMGDVRLSDRPWNDPGPRKGHEAEELARDAAKPILRAIVLDFSTVSHLDTTGTQALVDTRNEVERWANRSIEFHFAGVLSPWIKRALVACGFGTGEPSARLPAEIAASQHYGGLENLTHGTITEENAHSDDPELGLKRDRDSGKFTTETTENAPKIDQYGALSSLDTPFFHFDLQSAVRAAELGANASDSKIDRRSTRSYDKDFGSGH